MARPKKVEDTNIKEVEKIVETTEVVDETPVEDSVVEVTPVVESTPVEEVSHFVEPKRVEEDTFDWIRHRRF